jgi:D-alanine-D-alanine ligase
MNRKIRVGLVYGGKSGEHDVSLQTALAVIRAIDHTKYEVHPFYITAQGEWRPAAQLTGPVERVELLRNEPDSQAASSETAAPGSTALQPFFGTIQPAAGASSAQNAALDVVFPLLHGTYGEDGTIQGLLEMANLPYVGAGVLASAVGMDKVMMKKVFAQEGLPQCLFRHFTRTQWDKDRAFFLMEIEVSVGYPCFVKPANLGSSVGISKARNREDLIEAVDLACQYDRKVIVEEHVDAREIEVSVLGNEEPEASVPGEIVSSNEFYDYRAKYLDGKSAMIIPAELPEEKANEIREWAIRAFQAIDGSGLSRVDFFLRKSDGAVFINEINTMPGFTPFSMYPLLWKESGKPYGELLDDLIRLAIERHAAKQSIRYTFDA